MAERKTGDQYTAHEECGIPGGCRWHCRGHRRPGAAGRPADQCDDGRPRFAISCPLCRHGLGEPSGYPGLGAGDVVFQLLLLAAHWHVYDCGPDNWIALGACLITAMTAGQLSARAKRRAEEAEAGRREIERLYHELQAAFERASHAEALRQSERLKSALLDAVTHDLRTPLTSIKAAVTTLLDKVDDETPVVLDADSQRELLEVIDEETDRLNHFVENLVELARLEAGAMPLQRRWRAVDEILMTALERAAALTSRHQIHIAIAEDCPAVRVDARARKSS